jgi:frataxin
MEESAFESLAEGTLQRIADAVEDAGGDAEVDFEGGVLAIEIEATGTFLLNKHAPLQQLWFSSPVSGASHYAWDEAGAKWASTRDGGSLLALLAGELQRTAGVKPALED